MAFHLLWFCFRLHSFFAHLSHFNVPAYNNNRPKKRHQFPKCERATLRRDVILSLIPLSECLHIFHKVTVIFPIFHSSTSSSICENNFRFLDLFCLFYFSRFLLLFVVSHSNSSWCEEYIAY